MDAKERLAVFFGLLTTMPIWVAFTPIYCSSTVRPECYNTPGVDAVNFSFKNAYWVCNMTSNMVYPRYSLMFPTLKEVRDSLDNSYFAAQVGVEAKAQELYAQNPQAAVEVSQ